LPALAILDADPNPGGGPAEKRDADVAAEMESTVSSAGLDCSLSFC
jgi:hypothetical protein